LSSLLENHLLVRRLVGLTLAFIPLYLGGLGYVTTGQLQPSLSAYAHTPLAAWFIGLLFAAGAFLTTYRGYDALDRRTSAWAAAACFATAVFPTAPDGALLGDTVAGVLHGLAAFVLFVCMARFSWRLFPYSWVAGDDFATLQKLKRNKVYKACGVAVMACAVGVLVCSVFNWGDTYRAVFWLEAILLSAAGFSWYVKGEGVKALNDK
jgi:hypothetical protein